MAQLIPQFKYDHKSLSLISNDISNNSQAEVNNTNSNNTNTNTNTNYNYTINPDLINYISKVQSDQEKYRRLSTLGEVAEKKNTNSQYAGLNENIHFDTDKKNKARRSLLYLLNNISGGTFCPEINAYFNDLKETKKNEKLNNLNNMNQGDGKKKETLNGTLKENLSMKNPLTRMKTLKNQLLNNNQNNNPNQNNQNGNTNGVNNVMSSTGFAYNFKKRGKDQMITKIEKDGHVGIKTYKKDYKIKDLENVYSLDEIETGAFKFNYSKEAKAKMNLIKKEGGEKRKKKNKSKFDGSNRNIPLGKTSLLMKKDNSELINLPSNNNVNNTSKTKPDKLKDITAIEEADNSSSSL